MVSSFIQSSKQHIHTEKYTTTIRKWLRKRGIRENGVLIKVNSQIVYDLDMNIFPEDKIKLFYSLKQRK